jgi:hypothetical protein
VRASNTVELYINCVCYLPPPGAEAEHQIVTAIDG